MSAQTSVGTVRYRTVRKNLFLEVSRIPQLRSGHLQSNLVVAIAYDKGGDRDCSWPTPSRPASYSLHIDLELLRLA